MSAAYPEAPLGMRLRIAPGADLADDPSSYAWKDIIGDLVLSEPVSLKIGSEDEESETSTELTFTLRNPDGRFTTDNPESDLYPYFDVGCPVEWAVNLADGSGWHVLAVVYIASVADEWPAMTPYRCLARVTASGTFRRLGLDEALLSTLRRALAQTSSPVAHHWPLEEGSGAATAAPVIGTTPLVLGENATLEFGGTTPPGGAAAAPTLTRSISAALTGVNATEWAVEFGILFRQDTPTDFATIAELQCPGMGKVRLLGPDSIFSEGFGAYVITEGADVSAASVLSTPYISMEDLIATGWHHICVTLRQDGADIEVFIFLDYVQVGFGSIPSVTLTAPTSIRINHPTNATVSCVGSIVSLAILNEASPSQPFTFVGTPLDGYNGETAGLRLNRLCTEESVPVDAADALTPTMGPQLPVSLLTLLRECESADHGILSDHTGQVVLRQLNDLWDQTPIITVDGANRELFGPWQPQRDDQKRRNRARGKQPNGSVSALVEDAASIARHGVYDGDIEVNISDPGRLIDHASYAVAIGTVEGKRHPRFTIDLLRAPQFARAIVGMDLGDVVRVVNQPKQAAKGDLYLQIRGAAMEWLGRMRWRAELNCVSAEPYRAWMVEGAGSSGRLDDLPAVHTMAADAAPDATTLSVATAAGGQLVATSAARPADFPVDLNADGEQITVTAASGASSPQTLTVVRSVNGVRKTLKAGRPVTLWRPHRIVMETPS